MRTNYCYSVGILIFTIAYIIAGAYIFSKLETGESFMRLARDLAVRREMLYHYLTEDGHNVTDTETNQNVNHYLTNRDWDILYKISKGRCFKADAKDAKNHLWNFWSSMDFASTILTTIGYGGMVPSTTTGKLLVIIYGLPGMLLMMSYLNLFANCILKIINKIWKLIERLEIKIGRSDVKILTRFTTSVLSVAICFLMLVAYLVIMSLMLANSNANDTFLKSLYFYTITMTTVGLGDIAVIDHLWYGVTVKVLVVFCIGLALVTTLFGALTNMVSENRKRVIEVYFMAKNFYLKLFKLYSTAIKKSKCATERDEIPIRDQFIASYVRKTWPLGTLTQQHNFTLFGSAALLSFNSLTNFWRLIPSSTDLQGEMKAFSVLQQFFFPKNLIDRI
ncbi:hypothetical protein ACHWQZ_G007520 [Mnemiopsis leidyi]